MTRYGGGGGGGGRYGGGGFRGGRGGGRGGGKSSAPFPPVPSLMELTRTLVNRRVHLFQLCSSWREQTLVEIFDSVSSDSTDHAPSVPRIDPRTLFEHRRPPGDDEIAFHTGRLGVVGLRGWERG